MTTAVASKPHYGYIDCVRGYAVLMVMTGHFAYLFPNLPYPVHRLAIMGWYGVQLFFITSCLTLLMSWEFETRTRGSPDLSAFFIRRFFRIAPAYYAAGVLYFIILPPRGGFDTAQALATMAFVNVWHPLLTPTVAGRWAVVPGGWSIGVEFTFYLLFPLFASLVRSLRTAFLVVLALVVVGVVCNRLALGVLSGFYRPAAVQDFLFFWFPNEASVFGMGGVLFFIMRGAAGPGSGLRHLRYPTAWALGAAACFFALAFVPLGKFIGARPFMPITLAVCPPLMVFVLALSRMRSGFLVNPYAAAMGKVSFSAYLVHFAVLQGLALFPGLYDAQAVGYAAILAFVLTWPVAALLTFGTAWCSYWAIEAPGIMLGRALIRRRRADAAARSLPAR